MRDDLIFFVSSLTIASLYSLALIATLVAVRCKFHLPAIVMVSTSLFSFLIKALSDGLRYFLAYQLALT